jgi:hypothetical protein
MSSAHLVHQRPSLVLSTPAQLLSTRPPHREPNITLRTKISRLSIRCAAVLLAVHGRASEGRASPRKGGMYHPL